MTTIQLQTRIKSRFFEKIGVKSKSNCLVNQIFEVWDNALWYKGSACCVKSEWQGSIFQVQNWHHNQYWRKLPVVKNEEVETSVQTSSWVSKTDINLKTLINDFSVQPTLYLNLVWILWIPSYRVHGGGSRKKQKVDEDHPLASRWKVQFTLLKAPDGWNWQFG